MNKQTNADRELAPPKATPDDEEGTSAISKALRKLRLDVSAEILFATIDERTSNYLDLFSWIKQKRPQRP